MKRPCHYWFYNQLYLFNFRLVWPVNSEGLEKYVHTEFPEHAKDYYCHRDFGGKAIYLPNNGKGKGSTYIVALSRWSGNADDHSNLVHECLHIAGLILDHRDIHITLEHDEPLAYLTQYLVRQCLNVLLPERLRVVVDPKVKPKRR